MSQPQGAFVLVHGGHAGAWVWDELRQHLEHPSLAVDLPGLGVRPGNLASLTIEKCVRAILSELPPGKRLIRVSHSLGTAVVLALADRVAHIVCLAWPVPRPGDSIVASFPFLMRVASRFVLWFSRGEFAQSRRMRETTFFNGMDLGRVKRARECFLDELAALVQEPVRWSGRPPASCTYIKCLWNRGPEVKVVSLDSRHCAMLASTSEVAAKLNQIALGAKPWSA